MRPCASKPGRPFGPPTKSPISPARGTARTPAKLPVGVVRRTNAGRRDPVDGHRVAKLLNVENAVVDIVTLNGDVFRATGTDAIEAVMLLKPSALEGRRLKWKKHAWAIHNLIGHPIMQIMAWMGLGRAAVRFHDWTTPTPR